MTRRPLALALLLAASLVLAACGGSSDAASDPPSSASVDAADGGTVDDADVEAALEQAAPDGTVEVPSEDGATTIAEYAAGSGYEPANAEELAQLLAVVGTDADGYLTDDAFVVRTTEADAAVLCLTAEGMDIETYRVIPVRPDGTGVDCAA